VRLRRSMSRTSAIGRLPPSSAGARYSAGIAGDIGRTTACTMEPPYQARWTIVEEQPVETRESPDPTDGPANQETELHADLRGGRLARHRAGYGQAAKPQKRISLRGDILSYTARSRVAECRSSETPRLS